MTGDGHAAEPASLRAQVVETDCAVVLMFGERAYKIKKPVNLGFLDFRSRLERARVCRREGELNRRLALGVYLGVADVLDPAGEGEERGHAREVALASRSDLVELWCRPPIGVAAERAEQRLQTGASRSDAGRDVATILARQADPWPEGVPIDTLASPEEAVAAALKATDQHARHPVY